MVRSFPHWLRAAIPAPPYSRRWSNSSRCWHPSITDRYRSDPVALPVDQVRGQRRRHDVSGGEVAIDRDTGRAVLGVQRHIRAHDGVDGILGAAQIALALRGAHLPAQLDPGVISG